MKRQLLRNLEVVNKVHEEDVPPRMVEVEPSHEIVASEDHDMI